MDRPPLLKIIKRWSLGDYKVQIYFGLNSGLYGLIFGDPESFNTNRKTISPIDINNLGTIYKTLHTCNSINLKTFLHQMYLNIFI